MARLALTLLLALVLAAPAGAGIRNREVRIGQGISRADLGMTRDQVIAALGAPEEENQNGVLTYYAPEGSNIFDVYLEGRTVRMIIAAGRGYRTSDGIALDRRGALKRLKEKYPSMRNVRRDNATDERVYRIKSRLGARDVWTDFGVDTPRPHLGARITSVAVLFPRT